MLKTLVIRLSLVLCILIFTTQVTAQEKKNYAYLSLEPDIVTNYLGSSATTLGYVRVSVELMIDDVSNLEVAEHHLPLLRSTAIDIFGRQTEDRVKSLTGREDIRRSILQAMRDHMKRETGSGAIIKDVIFTKYLYQG